MLSKEKSAFLRSLEDADTNINPDDVWRAAKNAKCPLHDEFNWDIEEAAQEHWRDTARRLIRYVRMDFRVERTTYVVPVYIADPSRPPKTQRYTALTTVARDRAMAQRVLTDELDRIASAIRRASTVATVLGLSDQLEAMLEDVTLLRTKAERRREERELETRRTSRRRVTSSRSRSRPEARV